MTALPTIPERSLRQKRDALNIANRVRAERAVLKRDIKARRVSTRALLSDPPDFIATMRVRDLLLATPRYGAVKANKVMRRCQVSPSKTVSGLSKRQRTELIESLS